MYILQYLKTRTMEKTAEQIRFLMDLTRDGTNTYLKNKVIELNKTFAIELQEIIKTK